MSKKKKIIQKYLDDIEEIQKGFSSDLAKAIGGKNIVDDEKLNDLKKRLEEGNLPTIKDENWFYPFKKLYDNVHAPLLQVTQDILDGKITKEEGLKKRELMMDPNRTF